MMYINRQVGEVYVNCWGESRPHIELGVYSPIGVGCSNHNGCSLSAIQALRLADTMGNPPQPQSVKLGDGTHEMRSTWKTFRVKHNNGVHIATVGVTKDTDQDLALGFANSLISDNHPRSQETYYWPNDCEISLTKKHVKIIRGLLYMWAGEQMIGTRKQVTPEVVEDIPYLEEVQHGDS